MKSLINVLLTILFLSYSNTSFGADWFAYVPNITSDTIVPINLSTNTAGSSLNSGGSGTSIIAITPNALKAYVGNQLSSNVTVIDITTNTIDAIVSVGTTPIGIAITPSGQTTYVTNSASHDLSAIIIGPNTSSIVFDFGVDNNPYDIAITPDGTTAYIAIQGSGTLTNTVVRFDIGSNTLIGSPIPMTIPFNIAITPDGSKAYVTNFFDDTVTPIDLTTNTPLTPIPVGNTPFFIAISADGTTAFVTNQAANTVTPIDVSSDTPGTPIDLNNPPFGDAPFGIAITPDSQTGYVSDSNSADVTPFSTTTHLIDAAIPMPVGSIAPYSIAITPDQAPTALFTSNPAPTGFPTSFDASSSTSPVGTIAIYAWDFGDGNTATVFTPTTNHTYNTSGNFLVTLTVTNSGGTSTTQTFTGHTVSNNGGPTAVISQLINIISSTPIPPSNFIGIIKKKRFLNKTECVLKAKWDASPSTNVVFYRIYNKGIVVEEVPATSPLVFKTCLQDCSGKGFEIAAVSSDNLESSHLKIRVVHE